MIIQDCKGTGNTVELCAQEEERWGLRICRNWEKAVDLVMRMSLVILGSVHPILSLSSNTAQSSPPPNPGAALHSQSKCCVLRGLGPDVLHTRVRHTGQSAVRVCPRVRGCSQHRKWWNKERPHQEERPGKSRRHSRQLSRVAPAEPHLGVASVATAEHLLWVKLWARGMHLNRATFAFWDLLG